jgi:hypothetical protein
VTPPTNEAAALPTFPAAESRAIIEKVCCAKDQFAQTKKKDTAKIVIGHFMALPSILKFCILHTPTTPGSLCRFAALT